jgi:hypothetical protein
MPGFPYYHAGQLIDFVRGVYLCIDVYADLFCNGFTRLYCRVIDFSVRQKDQENDLKVYLLPYLFLLISVEGISPDLSFPRENIVRVSQTINATPLGIQQNLQRPINLDVSRHWFLTIFPMPYQVEAESLESGDIHTIDYRYHKWFFTNTHEGTLTLLIEEVSAHRIKTRILKDTSYLSSYMKLKGTEIVLTPRMNGTTEVTLLVFYDRQLDPAWYFQPLQEYGVTKMAEFLIQELMRKG